MNSLKEQRSGVTVSESAQLLGPEPGQDKRKRIVQGSGGEARPKTVDSTQQETPETSLIESDTMRLLREELRIEITTVQSCLSGVFVAKLRDKMKDNVNGKKVSITEVKKAINQIIQIFSTFVGTGNGKDITRLS